MEKEYEYSTKVKDINFFINYCKENDYVLINTTTRFIFNINILYIKK
ncbi:MAG: hypothetical protein ACLS90_07635 [Clostridia bacterium]